MSETNELINSLSDDELSVYTDELEEPHIIINQDRTIIVPDVLKKFAVQYDHNLDTVTFDCPRYVEGTDFYKAVMEDGFNIYIYYALPDGTQDAYAIQTIGETEAAVGPNLLGFDSITVGDTYEEISLTLTPGQKYYMHTSSNPRPDVGDYFAQIWGTTDEGGSAGGFLDQNGFTFTPATETVTIRFSTTNVEYTNLMLQEVKSFDGNIWVDPSDTSIFHFKWTITDSFTYQTGGFTFLVCLKKVNDNGETLYRWSTEICSDCRIIPGMDPTESMSAMAPDIFAQVIQLARAYKDSDVGALNIRMGVAEEDVDDLKTRMDTAESDIDDLKPRMTSAENSIGTLDERMDTAESDIDAVEARMDTAESDIDAVEARMDTAESDIDALEAIMGVAGENTTFNLVGPLGDQCTQLTTPGTYHMVIVMDEGSSSSRLYNPGIVCWDATCYESRAVVDHTYQYTLHIDSSGSIRLYSNNDDGATSSIVDSTRYNLYARLLYAFPKSE